MWENGWRQYIFSPSFPTIWSKDCLKDIQDFLQQLMDERKNPFILDSFILDNVVTYNE